MDAVVELFLHASCLGYSWIFYEKNRWNEIHNSGLNLAIWYCTTEADTTIREWWSDVYIDGYYHVPTTVSSGNCVQYPYSASTGPLASGRTQGSEPVPWMTTCELRLGLAKKQGFHKEIWDSNGKNDGLAYKSIGIRPYNLRLRY